jgi:hypothetical protein
MLGKCESHLCEDWTWNWQEYAFAVRALWKLVALRERSNMGNGTEDIQ